MKAVLCDKCGNQITDKKKEYSIAMVDNYGGWGAPKTVRNMDLCTECRDEIKRWFIPKDQQCQK